MFCEQRKQRKPRKGHRTQREVALVLGLSERAVRAIERRALSKLRRHPALRRLAKELGWSDLEEGCEDDFTLDEIRALLGLTRTGEERVAMLDILPFIAKSSTLSIMLYPDPRRTASTAEPLLRVTQKRG